MQTTQLARGKINADELLIELRDQTTHQQRSGSYGERSRPSQTPQAAQYHHQRCYGDLGSGVRAARGDPGGTAVICKIRALVLTSAAGVSALLSSRCGGGAANY
jgi:hypothetical protein